MAVAFLLFITACVGPLDRSCGYRTVEWPFASPQQCERVGHMEAGRIAASLDGTLSSVEVRCRVKPDTAAGRGPGPAVSALTDR